MNRKILIKTCLVFICLLFVAFIAMRQYSNFSNKNFSGLIATDEVIRETFEFSISDKLITVVITEPKDRFEIIGEYIYFIENQFFGKNRLLTKKTIADFFGSLELKDIDEDLENEFIVHTQSGKYEVLYIFDYLNNNIIPIEFNRDGKVSDVFRLFSGKIWFEDRDIKVKGLELCSFTETADLIQDNLSYYEFTSLQEFYHLINYQYIKYEVKEQQRREEITSG